MMLSCSKDIDFWQLFVPEHWPFYYGFISASSKHVHHSLYAACILLFWICPLLFNDNELASNVPMHYSYQSFPLVSRNLDIESSVLYVFVAFMSSASSAVTYTSVYTDSEPGRVFWGADEEISDGGVPRVIVLGYDGLPMQPVHPASPDYVPGPEHPPEYPEYLVPSEDEAPMEDQPLPADASPVALSPGYVPDSDPEEDSEEEHADYPADGGDGDDEPSDDDTDDDDADDDDEEPFEDDEEEEEHLAPADSPVIPIVDPVPSAGDTEAFETDESAPTPRPPQIKISPFAQDSLRLRARKESQTEPPMSAQWSSIAEHCCSTYNTSTCSDIRMRASDASPPLSLPPTSPRTDIPEAEMPPRKRACLTTPAPGYEIGESSAAGAARQPGPTPAMDTWDEIVEAMMEIAPTTLEGVNQGGVSKA
ncbi:hypothetical protein Tco_0536590 [Tanacetum coccineum]